MSQTVGYEWGQVVTLSWNQPLNAGCIIITEVYDNNKDFNNKRQVLAQSEQKYYADRSVFDEVVRFVTDFC